MVVEELERTPPPGSGTIFELALGGVVPLIDVRDRRILAEIGLGLAIALQDRALATLDSVSEELRTSTIDDTCLLIVDDERNGNLGITRPLQALQAFLTITFEVAWKGVVLRCSVHFRHVETVD